MINTFSISVSIAEQSRPHIFETNSAESVTMFLEMLPQPIDPSLVVVCEWNDPDAEYKRVLLDLFKRAK